MKGAIYSINDYVLFFIVSILLFKLVLGYFDIGLDSTDKDGFNRSGLHLYTDYKTGIEYLGDGNGALIERKTH